MTNFLQLYPMYCEYQKEIFELTEERMAQSKYSMDRCGFGHQAVKYQLDVDITVELTKAAMQIKPSAEADLPLCLRITDRERGRANDALCEPGPESQ
ncbi:hypothetical protein Desdi_0466 [Desulfitobacterium dichloroeliminans LMG P-21439]|uniref:Uncharacterized protein n=2 Tax=Desulfitobacterium dichloroeliminans TaxID=233055 RepID=L0F2G0_DESDL|nr:hypothetical protein Desdi_0466 [Desulfitobacterium dichloroeliminans LMG P-21439]